MDEEKAIILTSDVGLWRTKEAHNQIINLELYENRSEKEIEKEIKDFYKSDPQKTILYIDFLKDSGNLNDFYQKENEEKKIRPFVVSAEYIIEIC